MTGAVQTIGLAAARRIALAAQGFADPRPSGPVTRRHLQRVLSRLRLLQLDSVNVVTCAHYVPIASRLGPYPRELLDGAAWVLGAPRPDPAQAARRLVAQAASALGVVTEADLRDYYRLAPDRCRRAVAELAERGRSSPSRSAGGGRPPTVRTMRACLAASRGPRCCARSTR